MFDPAHGDIAVVPPAQDEQITVESRETCDDEGFLEKVKGDSQVNELKKPLRKGESTYDELYELKTKLHELCTIMSNNSNDKELLGSRMSTSTVNEFAKNVELMTTMCEDIVNATLRLGTGSADTRLNRSSKSTTLDEGCEDQTCDTMESEGQIESLSTHGDEAVAHGGSSASGLTCDFTNGSVRGSPSDLAKGSENGHLSVVYRKPQSVGDVDSQQCKPSTSHEPEDTVSSSMRISSFSSSEELHADEEDGQMTYRWTLRSPSHIPKEDESSVSYSSAPVSCVEPQEGTMTSPYYPAEGVVRDVDALRDDQQPLLNGITHPLEKISSPLRDSVEASLDSHEVKQGNVDVVETRSVELPRSAVAPPGTVLSGVYSPQATQAPSSTVHAKYVSLYRVPSTIPPQKEGGVEPMFRPVAVPCERNAELYKQDGTVMKALDTFNAAIPQFYEHYGAFHTAGAREASCVEASQMPYRQSSNAYHNGANLVMTSSQNLMSETGVKKDVKHPLSASHQIVYSSGDYGEAASPSYCVTRPYLHTQMPEMHPSNLQFVAHSANGYPQEPWSNFVPHAAMMDPGYASNLGYATGVIGGHPTMLGTPVNMNYASPGDPARYRYSPAHNATAEDGIPRVVPENLGFLSNIPLQQSSGIEARYYNIPHGGMGSPTRYPEAAVPDAQVRAADPTLHASMKKPPVSAPYVATREMSRDPQIMRRRMTNRQGRDTSAKKSGFWGSQMDYIKRTFALC